ncbi:DUF3429 domain-containing protein [Thalassotalea euphylliae]|nr:DUF3429 domain-containing protein [Thalassotalea euphylliae]
MTDFFNWPSLGYLGLIPFVFTLILTSVGITLPAISPVQLFIAYSACILSFLAGTLWLNGEAITTGATAQGKTQELATGNQVTNKSASIFSNVITLLAFACLLLPTPIAIGGLAIGFCLLLVLEFKWQLFTGKPAGYKMLRVVLTAVVVSCHVAMFGLIGR